MGNVLGQTVGPLVFSSNIEDADGTLLHHLTNVMIADIYVLGAAGDDRIY